MRVLCPWPDPEPEKAGGGGQDRPRDVSPQTAKAFLAGFAAVYPGRQTPPAYGDIHRREAFEILGSSPCRMIAAGAGH